MWLPRRPLTRQHSNDSAALSTPDATTHRRRNARLHNTESAECATGVTVGDAALREALRALALRPPHCGSVQVRVRAREGRRSRRSYVAWDGIVRVRVSGRANAPLGCSKARSGRASRLHKLPQGRYTLSHSLSSSSSPSATFRATSAHWHATSGTTGPQ
jgi:hypothetical protein